MLEIERKWLLLEEPNLSLFKVHQVKAIEQTYLVAEEGSHRVRRVESGGIVSYFETRKFATENPLVRQEEEGEITAERYHELLASADPTRHSIRKLRYLFTFAGQGFELDHILSPVNLWLLELELAFPDQAVKVPRLLGELREVSTEPGYSNSALARR